MPCRVGFDWRVVQRWGRVSAFFRHPDHGERRGLPSGWRVFQIGVRTSRNATTIVECYGQVSGHRRVSRQSEDDQ